MYFKLTDRETSVHILERDPVGKGNGFFVLHCGWFNDTLPVKGGLSPTRKLLG